MSHLWAFPAAAAFGRVLPKNKVYERADASTRVKGLFVKEVEQITWTFKLSPETINIPAHAEVQEIQVMQILLKQNNLNEEVLRVMDKSIPSPVIFMLGFGGKWKYKATFKRPSEADSTKWVIGDYHESAWMPEDTTRQLLPLSLDMRALYHALLRPMLPVATEKDETLETQLAKAARLRSLEREAQRLETRLKQEKQFNRKVEINAQLRSLRQEIEKITR